MPDKNKGIETNEKQFVDQAWNEMSGILDSEMPVSAVPAKNNHYTITGLALLLFVAGLLSGAAIYSLFWTNSEDQRSEVDPTQRISTLSSTIDQKNLIASADKVTDHTQLDPTSVISVKKSPVRFGQTMSYLTDQPIPYIGEESTIQPLKQEVPDIDVNTVKSLRTIPFQMIESELDDDTENLFIAKKSNYQPDPAIGLKAGLNIMRDNIWAGYYGGVIAQYPLTSSILVNTGLMYTHLENNDLVRFASSPMNSGQEKSSSTSYAILEEMDYISLPVGLSYQPFQFLRFSSGVNVSYLLNADAYYASLSDNPFALGRQDNSLLAFKSNAWNNLDISMVYGLTLFPTPKWGVDFSYNMAMTDFSRNQIMRVKDDDRNDFYQISILYYFMQK